MQRIAITGGTGFIGRHLAERYPAATTVIISRRTGVDIDDVDALTRALDGCDTVAHFAGINREIGDQTFDRVHVRGTATLIEAAKRAGVKKIIMLSFLRARPNTGSGYHDSKFAAEELIRNSGLDYTILKAGMIYGHGDHMVDHLSHTVQTQPLVATVGFTPKTVRPIPVAELVDIVVAAIDGRLSQETVAVMGAEELTLAEAVRRVAHTVGRPVLLFPAPIWAQRILAQVTEWTMIVPLVAKAQVRMLAEGVSEAAPATPEVPVDLRPKLAFTTEQIRAALPPAGPFCYSDLRISRHVGRTAVRATAS